MIRLRLELRPRITVPVLWLEPGEARAIGDGELLRRLEAVADEVLRDAGGWPSLVTAAAEEHHDWPTDLTLQQMCQRHCREVIACSVDMNDAARRLGVSSSTLYRWRAERRSPLSRRRLGSSLPDRGGGGRSVSEEDTILPLHSQQSGG